MTAFMLLFLTCVLITRAKQVTLSITELKVTEMISLRLKKH